MADPHEWLIDAEDVLRSASALITHGVPKHACFHSQQAAEKALKALLLHRTGQIPKSHDLGQLLNDVRAIDPTFPDHTGWMATLQAYYTLVRYPDARPPGATMPSPSEAQDALRAAETLLRDVGSRLP